MTTRTSSNPLDDYAAAVVGGELPAGKYHRLACERHQRDRAREGTSAFPYVLDLARVQRFQRFAEQLRHYKGEWARQPIRLQPHQVFRFGSIFGWVHQETGLRRIRMTYSELPRKQGKSIEAGVTGLYTTFFDGEPGAEGYTAATKREQANIVFNDAKQLVKSSALKDRIRVQVSGLHRDDLVAKLAPLGADYDSTDGLNPHFVCLDELHAHKTRGLIDVLETAVGARRQPLIFKITTAGSDPVSPCGDEHAYACQVLEGVVDDDTYFAFIAHADPEDDWLDERTWRKANPNYGISVKPEDMRMLAAKATAMPSAAATFKQKRLNLWVNAFNPCLSIEGWRQGQTTRTVDELIASGRRSCFIGVDLASKIDLCALMVVFPPTGDDPRWFWWPWTWSPEDTLVERAHRDRAPYGVWRDHGHLRTTTGTRIEPAAVRQAIREIRARGLTIEQIGFDPWHTDQLIGELVMDGFSVEQLIEVPQTYQGMSSACLRVQADILAGAIDAGSCPVTAWAVSNVVDQRDGKDNLMFVKKRSRGRIDPVIAGTIGVALWLRRPSQERSIYETRGLTVIGGG